jgi:hypothetical protein
MLLLKGIVQRLTAPMGGPLCRVMKFLIQVGSSLFVVVVAGTA